MNQFYEISDSSHRKYYSILKTTLSYRAQQPKTILMRRDGRDTNNCEEDNRST